MNEYGTHFYREDREKYCMDGYFSEKMLKRVALTWKSALSSQEGSDVFFDGSPARDVSDSENDTRVLLLKKMGVKKSDRILEVGSGGGGTIKTLNNAGFNDVVGITLGDGNIRNAKKKYGINLLRMDMHFTLFRNGVFDAVVGWHVFEHTPAPLFLGLEFNRILKRGGKLILEVPGGESFFPYDDNVHHVNVQEPWQMKNILRKAGFVHSTTSCVYGEPDSDGLESKIITYYGEKSFTRDAVSLHLRDIVSGKFLV